MIDTIKTLHIKIYNLVTNHNQHDIYDNNLD